MYISFQVRIVVKKLLKLCYVIYNAYIKNLYLSSCHSQPFFCVVGHTSIFCFDLRYEKIMLIKAVAGMFDA